MVRMHLPSFDMALHSTIHYSITGSAVVTINQENLFAATCFYKAQSSISHEVKIIILM